MTDHAESLPVAPPQTPICAVCRDPFVTLEYSSNVDADVRRLSCGHAFHIGCVRSLTHCPICRKVIQTSASAIGSIGSIVPTLPTATTVADPIDARSTYNHNSSIDTLSSTLPSTLPSIAFAPPAYVFGITMGMAPPPTYTNQQTSEYHPNIVKSMAWSKEFNEINYEQARFCWFDQWICNVSPCPRDPGCGCGWNYLGDGSTNLSNLKAFSCGVYACCCVEGFDHSHRIHVCHMCSPCWSYTRVESPTFVGSKHLCCRCLTSATYTTPSETQSLCCHCYNEYEYSWASGGRMMR